MTQIIELSFFFCLSLLPFFSTCRNLLGENNQNLNQSWQRNFSWSPSLPLQAPKRWKISSVTNQRIDRRSKHKWEGQKPGWDGSLQLSKSPAKQESGLFGFCLFACFPFLLSLFSPALWIKDRLNLSGEICLSVLFQAPCFEATVT